MNAVEIAQEKMERTAAAARTAALGTPRYITARQAADEAKAEFIAAYNAEHEVLELKPPIMPVHPLDGPEPWHGAYVGKPIDLGTHL